MNRWIEIPVFFDDNKLSELGIDIGPDQAEVDFTMIQLSSIESFNPSLIKGHSSIWLKSGRSFLVNMTYEELKNEILGNPR